MGHTINIATMLSLLVPAFAAHGRDGAMPLRDGSLPLLMSGTASAVTQTSRVSLPLRLNVASATTDKDGEEAKVTCETLSSDHAARLVVTGSIKLGQAVYKITGACTDEDSGAVEIFGSAEGLTIKLFGRTSASESDSTLLNGRLAIDGQRVSQKYAVTLAEPAKTK